MSIAAYLAKLSEGVNSSGILATSNGGTGTTSGGAFPTIISINYGGDGNDTATDTAGGRTVTLTGANFAANAKILINGVTAPVVTVVNPTTITFTTPAMAAGTYVLYVVNPDGSTAIAVPGISYSAVPVWTTAAGTVATITETAPINATLGISSNSTVTLSLLSGALPPGAVFNSNGVISGTSQITASPTTYTFTLRATDVELQDTDRQFSIVINPEIVTFSSPTSGGTVTAYTNLYNSINLSAIGNAGNTIASYSANSLPAGLTLAGSTISGTAATTGTSSTTLTATTANTNRSAQITFNWSVIVSGDLYWKNNALLLSGTSTADSSLSDYLILNNQLIPIGDTRTTNFNPYQAGYYSNQFNGTTDYLSVANNSSFANLNGTNFTAECWAYANSTASNACLMACTSNPTATGFAIFILSGNLTVYVNTGGTVIGSITFPLNTWNHVAFVRNGTTCTLYLNGAVVASATADITNPAATQPLVIGGITASTGWNSALYFNGYISNARVVKGTALYTAAFTPPTAPLTAVTNTQILTSRSNQFTDAGPNNFTITTAGTPSVQQFNPFGVPASATTNNLYSAYLTSATDSRLTVPAGTAFAYGTGDFTVEGWFFVPTMTAANSPIIFSQTVSGTNYFWNGLQSISSVLTGKVSFIGTGSGGGTEITSGSNLFTAGTWNHFAVCRVSGMITVYLNGQGGTATANATDFSNTSYVPTIGGYTHATSNNLNGYISNLRVVKGVAVYTSNFTPATTNLTAISGTSLLTFQDATIRDNSASALTITNVGTARLVAQSPFTQTTSTVALTNVGSTYFDGTGDAAYIAGDGNVVNFGNGDYTIECWIYHTTGIGWMDTCPGGTVSPTNRIQLYMNLDGSCTYITYQGTTTLIATATGLGPPRQWNHMALVKYNNQTKIYVNGVQGGSTYADTLTMPSQSNRPFIMGNGYDGSQGGTAYLSNYRITKGVALYTTTFALPTAPFTVGKGTQALFYQTSQAPNNSQFVDNSTAANPITRFGNTSQGTFAPYGANWSNYFDGTGDSLITPASSITSIIGTNGLTTASVFTIETWIYQTQRHTTVGSPILLGDMVPTSGVNYWSFGPDTTGLLSFFWYDGVAKQATGNTVIPLNTWTHISVVINATNIKLFVNGILQTLTGTTTLTSASTTTGALALGQSNNGGAATGYFGYVSNLHIVKSALYSTTFTPSITPVTPIPNTALLTCQDSRFVDNSANNFTITRAGDVSAQRFSPYGATIQTPQTYSNYVDTAGQGFSNATSLISATATTFTAECWVYMTAAPASADGVPCLIGMDALPASSIYLGFGPNASRQLVLRWFDGASKTATGGTTLALNTWYHIAVVSNANTLAMYVNGVAETLSGTTTLTNRNGTAASFALMSNSSASAYQFKGFASNIRVTTTAVYNSAFTPSTTPLTAVSGTVLLTCQDSTQIDNSVNKYTLTQIGTTSPRKFNPFGFTNTQGSAYTPALYGASAYFDGTGDYLATPATGQFVATGDFTIQFSFYLTSLAATNHLIGNYTAAATTDWLIEVINTGVMQVFLDGSTQRLGHAGITTGQWYHVSITRSGTTVTGRINGVPMSTTPTYTMSGTFGTATKAVYIGMRGGSTNPLFGYLSDVSLINGTAVYKSNFVPPQAPLTPTTATTLLLNMDKGALVDYTKSVNLETVADTKINNESALNGGYYSNYFDGSGDTFSTPAGLSTAMGTGFAGNILSFECWVFPQNHNFGANAQMIAGAYAAVSANGRWYIGFDKTANATTQLVMGWTTGTASQTGVTTTVFPITHGQWNHIAVTVDATTAASSTIKLFANGLLLNTFTAQDMSSQTAYYQPTQIGGCGSTTYTSEFHGYISNFRILKGSLAYTGNYTVPTAPLTAITNTVLLTCQGNTFKDNSIGNFALTRNGDVAVKSFNPFRRNTSTSMYFDGTGDYLSIPINPAYGFGTGDFTVEFWMNLNSLMTTEMDILDCQTTNAFCIYKITTSGALAWRPYAGTDQTILAHASIPICQWVHIAVSRSAGVTKAFVNGVQTNSVADATNYAIPTVVTTVGGRNGGTFGVPGYIEDLRITKGYARYTASFTPPTSKWSSN